MDRTLRRRYSEASKSGDGGVQRTSDAPWVAEEVLGRLPVLRSIERWTIGSMCRHPFAAGPHGHRRSSIGSFPRVECTTAERPERETGFASPSPATVPPRPRPQDHHRTAHSAPGQRKPAPRSRLRTIVKRPRVSMLFS